MAIAQLVHAESERAPVVVLVEDLHWIDTPSRELLASAVAKLAAGRVRLVVTHPPDHEGAWRPGGAFTQLRLQPLADAEVTTIIRAVAGGALPGELERRILEKAEGSPFFAEEITRALVEAGLVTAGEGRASTSVRSWRSSCAAACSIARASFRPTSFASARASRRRWPTGACS